MMKNVAKESDVDNTDVSVATDMLVTVCLAFWKSRELNSVQDTTVAKSLPESQDGYGKLSVHADAKAWETGTQATAKSALKYMYACNWSYFYTPKRQC